VEGVEVSDDVMERVTVALGVTVGETLIDTVVVVEGLGVTVGVREGTTARERRSM
jgi:hypothetical protein